MTAYHRPFPEDIVQYLMKQIVDAVKYHRHSKWVPVNGYYGMLTVQAQMAVDILTNTEG